MNRWYTANEYLKLVEKLRKKVNCHPEPRRGGAKGPITEEDGQSGGPSAKPQDDNSVRLTTDIIVGFPGETEEQFQHTVDLCKKVKFDKAYISLYSPRPMTAASKNWPDDVPHAEKKRRWGVLERMINKRVRSK
jgi:tRNA A37 methylthiotransferase MiaB